MRRMLGLGADGWNNLVVGFGSLAGVLAALAAVSAFVLFQLQKQDAFESSAAFEKYKLQAEAKLADANARAEEAKLKSAELERAMNPRIINDDRAKVFVERIKPFSGTPFSILADPVAEYKFVNRIIELLQEGGWEWRSYTVSPISLPSGSADIPSSNHPLIAGVQVRFNHSRNDVFNGPAKALSVALAEALGVSTSVVADPPESPLACSPDAILIEIRRKL